MADSNGNNNNNQKDRNNQPISILGTGDFSRALAKKLAANGRLILCGSRFPNTRNLTNRDPEIGELSIQVVGIQEAIEGSEVIFLGIHSDHVDGVLGQYKELLAEKILVDVSNPDKSKKTWSQAEQLASQYPNSHLVKGFNTLSAYALESSNDQGDNKVHLASDHKPSLDQIDHIAQSIGLETVTYSSLSAARELESRQNKLFRGWGKPLLISTAVFIAWTVFCIVRYHIDYGFSWEEFPLHTFNKVLGLTSFTLLGLCYLPGCVASIAQLLCCTKHRAFPFWLDAWLQARKQLGLLALWLAIVHGITSVSHNNQSYFSVFYMSTKIMIPGNLTEDLKLSPVYKMNWIGETTYSLGAIAVGLMGILGVTSLPSVGSRLNWKQWVFVQSYLGHVTLAVSIGHVFIQGWPYIVGKPFATSMKGVSTIALIIPILALGLRILLLFPCFSVPLYKIRRGWECCRSENGKKESMKEKNLKEVTVMSPDDKNKTEHLTTVNPLLEVHMFEQGKETQKTDDIMENSNEKVTLTTNIDDDSIEMAPEAALVTKDDDVTSITSSSGKESGIDNPAFSSQDEDNNSGNSSDHVETPTYNDNERGNNEAHSDLSDEDNSHVDVKENDKQLQDSVTDNTSVEDEMHQSVNESEESTKDSVTDNSDTNIVTENGDENSKTNNAEEIMSEHL